MQQPPGESSPVLEPLTPRSRPSRRAQLIRIVGTILSLALLVLLISAQGWDEFAAALRRIPAHYFWIALAFMFGSRIFVALRWFVLLRSAQVKMPLWQCFRLVFMGLFASNFLPTTIGGDLVRMAGAVTLGMDAGVSAASLVLDRLVGMAGMSSLAPVGLWIVLRSDAGLPGTGQMPFLLGGALSGLERLPGAAWVIKKMKKFFGSAVQSSALWLKKPSSLLLAMLCTYGHMLFTFLIIALLLHGMNETLSFWWIAGLWSLSYFITLVPVSVNGLGVQELSISLLYSHFGGISAEAGLALAIFWRVLPLLASLPGVLFLPEILRPLSAPRKAQTNG